MIRAALAWGALGLLIIWPLWVAATSPLLEWRGPVYVAAGLAGVAGLALMLVQPLLAAGALPGLGARRGRRVHRVAGALLLASVAVHVGGLWITSPPDVVDALLLRSPTPFSVWGVAAMWALLGAAGLAMLRPRLPLRAWRRAHTGLVAVAVLGTVVHAVLIVGTMGTASKAVLCGAALAATGWAVWTLRSWAGRRSSVRTG